MQRIHFFELEDFDWMPSALRDGGTDVLDFAFRFVGFYDPLVRELVALLDATGERTIVDLASGGGGGALGMYAALAKAGRSDVAFELTDRFPNDAAAARVRSLGDANVSYRSDAVDAMNVGEALRGVRTMFSAIHHFKPEQVRQLIQSAVDDRAPIALFDIAAPSAMRSVPALLAPLAIIPNAAALFVIPFALVPFVRPGRVSRLLLTYVLPAIPFLFAWDGSVSALRAYTPEELLEIAKSVRGAEGYEWSAKRGGFALSLTGYRKGDAPTVLERWSDAPK